MGLRKVASTSIQVWLQENAEVLRNQHDVLVLVRHKQFETWREAVYDYMQVYDCHGQIKKSPAAEEDRLRRVVLQEARRLRLWMSQQKETKILVSDENLFGARLYRVMNQGTANADDHTPVISTLYDWACTVLPMVETIWKDVFDLTFVLYIRESQYESENTAWIRSCYNQEVRNNRLELSYEEWVEKLPSTLRDDQSWNNKFRSLPTQLQSPMKVVVLGDEPQLGTTLLRQVDVDSDSSGICAPSQQHWNESIPDSAVDFMRAINQSNDISYTSKAAVGAIVASMRHVFVNPSDDTTSASYSGSPVPPEKVGSE